jgi:hypothetical protein
VLTAQRKVFSRSALSGIFVNKHNFLDQLTEPQRAGWQPGNQVAGLEYNHYSKDNRWEAESYYHRSFSPDPKQRGATFAQFVGYNDRKYNLFCGYNRIDSTYSAEAGFVPRPGIQGLYVGGGLMFYPQRGWLGKALSNLRLGVLGDLTYSLKGRETDRDVYYNLNAFFKNQSSLIFGLYNGYTYLFENFDLNLPLENGERPLPGAQGYSYSGFRGMYMSSTSFDFQAEATLDAGGYFNGNYISAQGRLAYRTQPFGLFSVLFSYNDIRLPQPYPSHRFWLIGPRAELAFSRTLFFSSFFQYNTQFNNFNVNARLQWRFAPVSDLFLVYTDNSYAERIPGTRAQFFTPKNKALVLKAVYWLNV